MSDTIIHSRHCQWTPDSLFGCSCGRTDMNPIDEIEENAKEV
jgi:hypothetical protein